MAPSLYKNIHSLNRYLRCKMKEFPKNSDVIVHASSTSRLFEMLNSKTSSSDRKIGLGGSTNGGCRSLNDIMTDINSSIASLDSAGQSEDNSSLFEGSSYTTGGSMTESMAELAAEDMIVALRTQRAHLLERRAEMQMRVIMLEQEESAILSGERVQPVAGTDWTRKHVNTGFSINNPTEGIGTMDEVSQLEFDVEIQKKIVHAARRLAREHGIGRNVKRERKTATQRALLKLQELERKLQSAKRFQRPVSCGDEQTDSEHKQKLHEHQTYYKAVSDNGYYPHFRKPRTISSTSEDKISVSSDQYESENYYENVTIRCHDNTLTPRETPVKLREPSRESRHSSSSSTNTADNCVRASLQMSLASDTKTQPRRWSDSVHVAAQDAPPASPELPSSAGSSTKDRSFFAPWTLKIDNLTTSLRSAPDAATNKPAERKYEQYRPRAGSFRPAENSHHVVNNRYDNGVDNSIHSYDKYLQTLRQNRQRNGVVDLNRSQLNHHGGKHGIGNGDQSKRHSLDLYEAKSPQLCGHVTISTVPTTHSTAV